jgi:hypothetical protein
MGAAVEPNAAGHVVAQHDGHAVVNAPYGGVRLCRYKGEGALAAVLGGDAAQGEVRPRARQVRPRLLGRLASHGSPLLFKVLGVLPLIEGVDGHQHPPVSVRLLKGWELRDRLGPSVEQP